MSNMARQRVRRAQNDASRLLTLARDGDPVRSGERGDSDRSASAGPFRTDGPGRPERGEQKAAVSAVVLRNPVGHGGGERRPVRDAATQKPRTETPAVRSHADVPCVRERSGAHAHRSDPPRTHRPCTRPERRRRDRSPDRVRQLGAARPAAEQLGPELGAILEPRVLGQDVEGLVESGHVLVEPPEDEIAAVPRPRRSGARHLSGRVSDTRARSLPCPASHRRQAR